jgi:hypothetical protein
LATTNQPDTPLFFKSSNTRFIYNSLAHAVRDANGRAYNRTSHLKDRAGMMQGWADYLDSLKAQSKAGNVITAKFGQ